MIDIEKLEDILHREKLKELQKEIDELPDTHGEMERELHTILDEINSADLYQPHGLKLNQTMWKEKHLKPKSELEALQRERGNLEVLYYARIAFASLQVLFTMGLLWFVG